MRFIDETCDISSLKDKEEIEYICKECGNKYSKKFRGTLNFLCNKCARANSYKEKYGCNFPSSILEKRKKTNLEKYGVEFAQQTQQAKDKMIETRIKTYGNASGNREKIEQTMLERYGSKSSFSNPDLKKKAIESRIKNWEDTCEKIKESQHKRTEESLLLQKEKARQTNLERYGVEWYSQTEESKQRIKETCLEKYGAPSHAQNHEVRLKQAQKYTYDNRNFDSGWEVYVYIYCVENGLQFEYQPNTFFNYDYKGEHHKYFPDFKIENNFYEIKSPHFFENGKMINPYDRSKDGLFEAKHQCMIKNNIEIITDISKYKDFVDSKFTKNFVFLFKNNMPFPYFNPKNTNMSDTAIIKFFHKSIYEGNVFNKPSPIQAWNDKNLIKKCAINRLKYKKSCTPQDIIQGFNVAKIAPKVSVFSPAFATDLIKRYLNDFNVIFDPFSGFSGRMIGALRNNKKYIGQDINETHIKESIQIKNHLNYNNCELKQQDILTDIKTEYDCLFTCPPYDNKEHWGNETVVKSCDEWIDICLQKYKCKKYLFVVDKTSTYKSNIVKTIENTALFGNAKQYVILISESSENPTSLVWDSKSSNSIDYTN